VDISIAVATDAGLITPIIRGADKKPLAQISAEVRGAVCVWEVWEVGGEM